MSIKERFILKKSGVGRGFGSHEAMRKSSTGFCFGQGLRPFIGLGQLTALFWINKMGYI